MNHNLDARYFYPEVFQAVAGDNYTVYAYMNDGAVREFDVFHSPIVPDMPEGL